MEVADTDTWLLQTAPAICCVPTFQVTNNGGLTWTQKQFPEFSDAAPVGVAPDGSFRVLAWHTVEIPNKYEAQLFRIDSAGNATPLGPLLEKSTTPPRYASVDDIGATWIPIRSDADGLFKVAIVAGDGSLTTHALPEPETSQSWRTGQTVLGMRLLRFAQEGPYSGAFQETYRMDALGQIVPAEKYPVTFIDGELWLSDRGGASWDSGAHWVEGFAKPVRRAVGLGMPRFLSSGRIARRYSAFLFEETAETPPPEASADRIVDTGTDLVAWNKVAVYVRGTDLPALSTAIGTLAPDTQRLLDRANQFRADAGLPPLVGDALVSQASRNHSAYSALHPEELERGDFHSERTGTTGFTGVTPSDRCEAVGTYCFGEIAFGAAEEDPVGAWLATPFHRPLIGSPESGVVGGGRVSKGASVMNIQDGRNILIRPFGYPNGRWRGDDGFAGESPDPVKRCKELGQSIEYPVGIAVSLYAPVPFSPGKVTGIQVRKQGNPNALAGCFLSDSDINDAAMGLFVLDDPLEAGKTYDAEGQWYPGNSLASSPSGPSIPAASLTHRWSFTYEPEKAQKRKKKKTLKCGGKKVTISGTGRRDVIRGTKRADVVDGGVGNDLIKGLGGRDTICGGRGRDRLFGGKGRDALLGGDNNDRLSGGGAGDGLYGGNGRDRLSGGLGRDRLSGGPGRDRYSSGPGRDLLYGTNDQGR